MVIKEKIISSCVKCLSIKIEFYCNKCFSKNIPEKQEEEAVVQRCSVKKVFLKISQNSQENSCARLFLNKEDSCTSEKLEKFLRTSFFTEHLRWLRLFPQIYLSFAIFIRRKNEKQPLEISQNSQENACAKVSFLIKLKT